MKPKTLTNARADSATVELTDYTSEPASVYLVTIRPEVAKFAIEMETVLRENDHKSGWDKLDIDDLYLGVMGEVDEFNAAYMDCVDRADDKSLQDMRREALDIANFCMFLCHNYPKMEE